MTKKEILDHLKSGGSVCDYREFDPGMCSNGGHYAVQYRLRNGVLYSLSTCEDAEWTEEYVEGFVEFVLQTWDDGCYYLHGSRWSLDD
jgi:hypothetical protein